MSEKRNDVVDMLFDQLITFQLDALKAATKAIHEPKRRWPRRTTPQARALVKEARDLIAAMPVTEAEAASAGNPPAPSPAARRRARARPNSSSNGRPSPSEHYAQAQAKAEEALKLAR